LRDVAPAFRASAVVMSDRLRALAWLLASPRHRSYLTPRLGARLLFYGVWSVARPYTPYLWRRAARWFLAGPTRRTLARRCVE
jgi:hypothetical protein